MWEHLSYLLQPAYSSNRTIEVIRMDMSRMRLPKSQILGLVIWFALYLCTYYFFPRRPSLLEVVLIVAFTFTVIVQLLAWSAKPKTDRDYE